MKKITAHFYQSHTGKEPVKDFLRTLDTQDRKIIGIDIKTVEFGWPIGMPTCKSLGKGLYEIRSDLSSNKIARIIFSIDKSRIILLHAFIKKDQKIPKKELELAKKRYMRINL